jgi:uncharacterized C2H2 Zn-finger protein
MTLQEIVILLVIIVITIVVPLGVSALINRGKRLKCPDCGYVFKAPLMDEKTIGVGWTFPYIGKIECPHCHAFHSRRDYPKVEKIETTTKSNL